MFITDPGRCTIAVLLLSEVPPLYLPEPRSGDSEVSTFADIHDMGLLVTTDCLKYHYLGRAETGKKVPGDLGVFAFGTRSQIDRDLPRGFHPSFKLESGGSVEIA